MPEREWLIEEFWTEGEHLQAQNYLLRALEQREEYLRGQLRPNDPWRHYEAKKELKEVRQARGEIAFDTKYQPWTPIFLFRPTYIKILQSGQEELCFGPYHGYAMSQIVKISPFNKAARCVTLERCVELWREVERILQTKQLRIRNVYTDEIIPCEAFG